MENKTTKKVVTYIFNKNDSMSKYTTRRLLVKLFSEHPTTTYKCQEDMVDALATLYGVRRTQSAISKGLKTLAGHGFKVGGQQYAITSFGGTYMVQREAEFTNNLRDEMKHGNLFQKECVYYEHSLSCPQTFVFWIDDSEDKKNLAEHNFNQLLQNHVVEIFYVGNRLVIMLDPKSHKLELLSDILKNFFTPHYDAYKKIK